MLIGYARIFKADGSQSLDLQRDALAVAGVQHDRIYEDQASGVRDERPGRDACLHALREGDVLVVWKLDRLGRTLSHLVNTAHDLSDRGIGLRVLTGQGAEIDTTTSAGRMIFGDRAQKGDSKPGHRALSRPDNQQDHGADRRAWQPDRLSAAAGAGP